MATAATIVLSAMTGLLEIRRGLVDPAYAINDCNLLTAHSKVFHGFLPTNYLGRLSRTPAWLLQNTGERLTEETRKCWPDYPLVPESAR